ncbi:MAG TPA: TatD family hydrolase [Candidatus Paceibacterota bacterium]|nr:TatD family hydrolase [Candidatus Paceibacterota bacterium]
MTDEARFIDAHTHVQFPGYDADRDAVLGRAREQGVVVVNVGTQRDTSRAAVELAERMGDGVYAAVGLHPVHTAKSHHDEQELGGGEAGKAFAAQGESFDAEHYRRLALHAKTVAIGECGLDYFRFDPAEDRDAQTRRQREAFVAQIELAREVAKPLMIHCRNAFADLIEILSSPAYPAQPGRSPGIIHFFTGTPDDARRLVELGFSFTFGGVVTFARDYDEAVRLIPADRILSETDAPYVAPVPYRGKRNEPAYVIETVKKLAELKGMEPDAMKRQIWENARRVFGI